MESMNSHVEKLENELRGYGVRLDKFVAKAASLTAEAKIEQTKRIDGLKMKHKAAQARLDELKAAGEGKWETFKLGIENAWGDLESAFKAMRN